MDTLYLYPTLRDYETIPHQRQLPHLPAELLTEIARHSLQREKAELCRTSKQWKEIATKELFRNIELLVPFFHDAKMLQTMQTCTRSLCQSMVRSSINRTFTSTQTLAIEGYSEVLFEADSDTSTPLEPLIEVMITSLPNLKRLSIIRLRDSNYMYREIDRNILGDTCTRNPLPLSTPGLIAFTGPSAWLNRIPSRHTISELVLVDENRNWSSACLQKLVKTLHEFTALKSLELQTNPHSPDDDLYPSSTMALISEQVPWLKELTLCYYDFCPCSSLDIGTGIRYQKPDFPELTSLTLRVFSPISSLRDPFSSACGNHITPNTLLDFAIYRLGQACPNLTCCSLLGGCGADLHWTRKNDDTSWDPKAVVRGKKRWEESLSDLMAGLSEPSNVKAQDVWFPTNDWASLDEF